MLDLGLIQRSGKTINACFNLYNVTPHSTTTRYTYTVDPGSAALFYLIRFQIMRVEAATTLGTAGIVVYISLDGTNYYPVYSTFLSNNTVGASAISNPFAWIPLKAGEIFRIDTYDSSTGGSCNYYVTVEGYLIR
jgi:hypothetical protein